MIRQLAALLTLGCLVAGTARAAEPFARYRGTVETRDGETLTIRQRTGGSVTMLMNPKTRMFTATEGRLRDIKPESYIGIVAVREGDGPPKPTEVTIFSPSERGFEAGSQPWDTAAGATLTAGWIAEISWQTPRRVVLRYTSGQASFTIPQGTRTTQMGPGEKALLVEGAEVTAFVRTDAAGVIHADLVAVGRQGAVPTL
ncbi:hypothetical protein [Methylobacterium trifolii]|uniref:DUF5666 domain-containing protein n=1 Tax=Methylobacterium trifolii TaxID=1003092 RepID=A0ABQ4U6G7_9HYPH|nr:hypothetical protein [Methylobacterium trifolii]GJE62391.1 hypothetical protein MPOCJGCO_4524 [Methylobacterium trifolii]